MKYRFTVTKDYQLDANSYEEAIALLNSEHEYNFIVNEEWQQLEGDN